MPRGVLKNGQIQPIGPLPPEWEEGQEVVIEAVNEPLCASARQSDHAFEELAQICKNNDANEVEDLAKVLAGIRQQGREQARLDAGMN